MLDVETSAFGAATSAIAWRSFDATISALDAETLAIARSYQRYRREVSGDRPIGDCGVGITPQCVTVTNHGDMSTFSKPDNSYQINGEMHVNYPSLLNLVGSFIIINAKYVD